MTNFSQLLLHPMFLTSTSFSLLEFHSLTPKSLPPNPLQREGSKTSSLLKRLLQLRHQGTSKLSLTKHNARPCLDPWERLRFYVYFSVRSSSKTAKSLVTIHHELHCLVIRCITSLQQNNTPAKTPICYDLADWDSCLCQCCKHSIWSRDSKF